MGRTDTNRLVFFDGPVHLVGSLVPVLITDVRAVSLSGKLANDLTVNASTGSFSET